jgi:hypothetical protein
VIIYSIEIALYVPSYRYVIAPNKKSKYAHFSGVCQIVALESIFFKWANQALDIVECLLILKSLLKHVGTYIAQLTYNQGRDLRDKDTF